MSASASAMASNPGFRALVLAIVFVTMAKAYAMVGQVVIRRLGTTKVGRRLAPALAGAGLGLWAVLVWVAFS